MTIFKSIPSISPLVFFDITASCFYVQEAKLLVAKKFKLPSMDALLQEESFVAVFVGWHEERLQFRVEIEGSFDKADLNDYRKSDSIELFIDTRNLKQKTTLGRFCHHLVFFAEKVEGALGHEITRFRGDDIHTLCTPTDLLVEPVLRPKYTIVDITVPALCLHGYNPIDFPKIGFSYRINKKEKEPQHFSNTTEEIAFEKNPSLWATLECKKK